MHNSRQPARRRRTRAELLTLAIAALAIAALALACSDASEPATPSSPVPRAPDASENQEAPEPAASPEPEETPSQDALVKRGGGVYQGNCIACHNTNPSIEGGVGPAIAGASRELIEARVIRGEYPEGYTPKRDTNLMIALPYLEPDIDALAAFLAQ